MKLDNGRQSVRINRPLLFYLKQRKVRGYWEGRISPMGLISLIRRG